MKIKPILTEKTMENAKNGTYTFSVPSNLNKYQLRGLIGKAFGVNVKKVRTSKNKTFVRLESGQTIEVFGEKKKKKAKKNKTKK